MRFHTESVKEISRNAVANCKNLREVTFEEENRRKIIGDYIFGGCSGLARVGFSSVLEPIE